MSISFVVKYLACGFVGDPRLLMHPFPEAQVAPFLAQMAVNQLPMEPPEEESEEEAEDDLNNLIDPRSWKTWLVIGFLAGAFIWTLARLDTGYQVLFKIAIKE
ncbi:hypothetical protein CDAR_320101 [Caerostris darwini]|uniref:Uncharacterized protein n=1 Tax=Caerostris darwini TaxID=1538125 RepID=A0AAV4WY66_9ARAC|nr:hypothetical protein CDAR_320101 [Caerostris darwini]